jgi:dipeptidyl aminopeptidase/acylaminoacyl peptidase
MMKELDLSPKAEWKSRFRASNVMWAKIATRNPARGLVCTNRDGVYQLYGWDIASEALHRLTDAPAGVVGGLLSADGEWVYYLRDAGGNEIGHFVRVPFAGGEAQDITPDMPLYASFSMVGSDDGRALAFLTAGPEGFKAWVQLEGAAPRSLYQCKTLVNGLTLSADGSLLVVATTERSGSLDASLLAFDTTSGAQVAELWDGEGSSTVMTGFSPIEGDQRVLATSSRSGYLRPLIWNPRTGERVDLTIDAIPGDVTPWTFAPDAKSIVLSQFYQATQKLFRYDVAGSSASALQHPSGVVGGFFGGDFTPEGDLLVTLEDSTSPARLVLLDGQTGAFKRELIAAGAVPAGRRWRSISFTGALNQTVQGWVATPEGEGPFPMILHPHGGPTWAMPEMYDAEAQTWLEHGIAFMTINYHGSTSFGKDFEKSLWHNLGNYEVEDVAAAYHWAVENKIAMPDSVIKNGASYGGYLTLQSVGKAPTLWAGGIAEIAIADWGTMYEDQAETLRGYQRALFGGTPDETPELTRSASPITYAEAVRAPVMVLQGSNDTRCPPRQMRLYEERLKALDKPIQIHWFEAGHGSRASEEQIGLMEKRLAFAYAVLG